MDYNEFVKSWNPPHPLQIWLSNSLPPEHDSMVRTFDGYNFPWYKKHIWAWHGLKCWWATGKWPERILYFKNREERNLYMRVLRENGLLQK